MSKVDSLDSKYFSQSAISLAPKLLGCIVEHQSPEGLVAGIITETEAYLEDDQASHSYKGENKRNQSMFLEGGHLYVYLSYGIHYCLNITSGKKKEGEAVLIRSIEITKGQELASKRRRGRELANGPGKLSQALGINLGHDGLKLDKTSPIKIKKHLNLQDSQIKRTPRIGITKATEKLWRFYFEL